MFWYGGERNPTISIRKIKEKRNLIFLKRANLLFKCHIALESWWFRDNDGKNRFHMPEITLPGRCGLHYRITAKKKMIELPIPSHLPGRVISGIWNPFFPSLSLNHQDSSAIWHLNNKSALFKKIRFLFFLYFSYGETVIYLSLQRLATSTEFTRV